MRISEVSSNLRKSRVSFGSIRTDRQQIKQLKDGETPIIDNKKQQIYAALNSISQNPTRNNVMFLLDVADNLAYGQGENSEFKDELDASGLTPEERENTAWSKLLADTVRKAISSSDEDLSDLEDEFTRIFSEKKELTPIQKEILDSRRQLLAAILDESAIGDEEDLTRIANLRKNIDYFTASSEIPAQQKKDCFDKLLYFLGNDYEIVPELQDKKIQILDEIFSDMLVKVPQDEVLTTKGVDQRQSGICAAISICRKAIAYEDKANFVDLITEELRNSDTMSVYDITELGSGKKVTIPKIPVDYVDAMNKGYRIIDASAHIWMQNAHASGDGTIQTEYYIPFDSDDYDIYNDSSWFTNGSNGISHEKLFLMTLIKEKELLKSFKKMQKSIASTQQSVSKVKKEVFDAKKASRAQLLTTLTQIFPQKSQQEIGGLIHSLTEFYTDKKDNNEVNISDQMPEKLKEKILSDYLISLVPDISEEEINEIKEKATLIHQMVEENTTADAKLEKLQRFNQKRSKYIYNKRLYRIAAAHRLAVESNLQLDDSIGQYEKMTGFPPRDIQIRDYMKAVSQYLDAQNAGAEIITAEINGEYNPEALKKELLSDTIELDTNIPRQLDDLAKTFFGKSTSDMVLGLLFEIRDEIASGNKEYFEQLQHTIYMNGDRKDVLKYVDKLIQKLSNTPSEETVLGAIRDLGYNNRIQFFDVTIDSFLKSLEQNLTDEQYQILMERFNAKNLEDLAASIEESYMQFSAIKQKQEGIEQKWSVPSVQINILEKLEKQHFVLSRRNLDKLKNRFATIDSAVLKNEKIKNTKERKKANNKLYEFTSEEQDIFNSIEKHIALMRKYCKTEYQEMNKYLYDELESLYSTIGMLNGQFWVREEGSSGLTSNEQVRILEQMTGKPYHIEKDIKEAAKQVKTGQGSGILSISVDDSDYAFHAQYVPSVSSERFRNPITGEEKIQDIIWTDNSWGKSEKEHFWNGHDGFEYTDYNNGYGWKNGFILAKDYRIGLPVQDIFGAIGTAKEDNDKFGLFMDMVLPGMPVNAYQKLYKMFNYIFKITDGEKLLESLEQVITDGYRINPEKLEKIDDLAEIRLSRIRDRIKRDIHSEEDFNKLPENDEIKVLFNKLSIYLSSNNPQATEEALESFKANRLDEAKETIRDFHLDAIKTIIAKAGDSLGSISEYAEDDFNKLIEELNSQFGLTLSEEEQTRLKDDIFFDEELETRTDGSLKSMETELKKQIQKVAETNIKDEKARAYFITKLSDTITKIIEEDFKIKSLSDTVIANSPVGEQFIAAIDKYYAPSSDEELLAIIQKMQNQDNATTDEFFNKLSDEEIGIKTKSPYEYIQMYKTYDSDLEKALTEIVTYETVASFMNVSADEDISSTPEEIYRSLYISLSDLDVQKFIKAYKAEAFQKYQVRQAFPQPIPISDDILAKATVDMIDALMGMVDEMENTKTLLNILTEYNKMMDNLPSTQFFKDMKNLKDNHIAENEQEAFNAFKDSLDIIYSYTENDKSLDVINTPLKKLIYSLNPTFGEPNLRKAGQYLKQLISVFNDFEASGISEDRYIENKKNNYKTIQEHIGLLVNANIDPKYADDGIHRLNKLLKHYNDNYDEEKVAEEEKEFVNFLVEKHITKNPTAILKKVVKMLQEGKKDTDEYAVLRTYLTSTLQVAEQTKIQYKLVQNQHTGISSKTKNLLSLFKVYLKDNTTDSLESEHGILYLVEQLKNSRDNNATLKLFLNQSGLSKAALRAIINNLDLESFKRYVEEDTNDIQFEIKKLNTIAEVTNEYFAKSRIKYRSIGNAAEQLVAYLKRQLPDDSNEEMPIYSKYFENILLIGESSASNSTNPTIISSLLREYSMSLMQEIAERINLEIEAVSNLTKQIAERAQLIGSITVPVESEEYQLRQEFFEKFEEANNFFSETSSAVAELVENCSLLAPLE